MAVDLLCPPSRMETAANLGQSPPPWCQRFQARPQEEAGSEALEAPRCQLVQMITEPPAPRSAALT